MSDIHEINIDRMIREHDEAMAEAEWWGENGHRYLPDYTKQFIAVRASDGDVLVHHPDLVPFYDLMKEAGHWPDRDRSSVYVTFIHDPREILIPSVFEVG